MQRTNFFPTDNNPVLEIVQLKKIARVLVSSGKKPGN
jgi:hypothetical protein